MARWRRASRGPPRSSRKAPWMVRGSPAGAPPPGRDATFPLLRARSRHRRRPSAGRGRWAHRQGPATAHPVDSEARSTFTAAPLSVSPIRWKKRPPRVTLAPTRRAASSSVRSGTSSPSHRNGSENCRFARERGDVEGQAGAVRDLGVGHARKASRRDTGGGGDEVEPWAEPMRRRRQGPAGRFRRQGPPCPGAGAASRPETRGRHRSRRSAERGRVRVCTTSRRISASVLLLHGTIGTPAARAASSAGRAASARYVSWSIRLPSRSVTISLIRSQVSGCSYVLRVCKAT